MKINCFIGLISLIFSYSQTLKSEITVKINPDITYQTIDGFGASDCWTVNYVGKYWNDLEKEKAAKWLFSSEFDSKGNPKGIGLSIWRFNLGGGTAEQGDSSHILDITRRAECFIDNKGNYDWTKQAGQQWFLDKAKSYGCQSFVAFSNTPPVFFTRNGHGFGEKDGNSNLKPDYYSVYAEYLKNATNYFSNKKGINFEYISPINEPQWNWDGTYQEGSPWHNEDIKKMVLALDNALQNSESKILISEAGSWSKLFNTEGRASNQIKEFFDLSSPNYLGNLKTINNTIASHSYWTDAENSKIKLIRDSVWRMASKYNLKVLQTEWSLLSNPPLDGFPNNFKDATYNDIALYMAKIIYADLVYANVSSWSFWTSMDVEMYEFKNRFNLIRLHTKDDRTATICSGGKVSAMKNLWMLGNYSLFIRPGYKRIDLTGADDLSSLMGSAYKSPDGKRIVSVYNNLLNENVTITIVLPKNIISHIKNIDIYKTDETADLNKIDLPFEFNRLGKISIARKSVVTIVYEFS